MIDIYMLSDMSKCTKILIAAAVSTVCTMVLWIWWGSFGLVFCKEEIMMNKITALSLCFNKKYTSIPKDFVFVNTAHDLALVDSEDEYGFPMGNACITDRAKLTLLLQQLQKSHDYKYIFLDILLDKQNTTIHDSALVATINNTPRLVCAASGAEMIDGIEIKKQGQVDYVSTIFNDHFCQYLFTYKGRPSMAYKAYCELHPDMSDPINYGFMPILKFNITQKYNTTGDLVIYDMGADVLDSLFNFCSYAKDKYIFIGAYGSDDTHGTYLGSMDGIQIHANAFAQMLDNKHAYHVWMLAMMAVVIMTLFIFVYYKKTGGMRLIEALKREPKTNKFFKAIFNSKWFRFLLSFVTFELIFMALFTLIFLTTNQLIEITSLSILFTLIWNIPYSFIIYILNLMNKATSKLKHLKFVLCMTSLCALTPCAGAKTEQLKILNMTSPKVVTIDGCKKTIGDTILSTQRIVWNAQNQAMKVERLRDKSQYIISARQRTTDTNLTLNSYLSTRKAMAHRAGPINTPEALQALLPDTLELLDKIEIPIDFKLDESRFFFIEYEMNQEKIRKKLPLRDGFFTLDRSIYTVDGKHLKPFPMPASIYYYDENHKLIKIVKENIFIEIYD